MSVLGSYYIIHCHVWITFHTLKYTESQVCVVIKYYRYGLFFLIKKSSFHSPRIQLLRNNILPGIARQMLLCMLWSWFSSNGRYQITVYLIKYHFLGRSLPHFWRCHLISYHRSKRVTEKYWNILDEQSILELCSF